MLKILSPFIVDTKENFELFDPIIPNGTPFLSIDSDSEDIFIGVGGHKHDGTIYNNNTHYSETSKANLKNVDLTPVTERVDNLSDNVNDLYQQILEIAGGGSISVATMSETMNGIGRPDNQTIKVDNKGVLSVIVDNLNIPKATPTSYGIVQPDNQTIQVNNNGIISIKNFDKKLIELKDVNASDLQNKKGFSLVVNQNGDGFVLQKIGTAVNKSFVFDIDYTTSTNIYDLYNYKNTAISADVEVAVDKDWQSQGNVFELKYMSTTGAEYVEEIVDGFIRTIHNRDMNVSIYAKGKGKISIDILSLVD